MDKNKDIEFRVWRLGRFLGSVWNEGERERQLLGLLKGSYSNSVGVRSVLATCKFRVQVQRTACALGCCAVLGGKASSFLQVGLRQACTQLGWVDVQYNVRSPIICQSSIGHDIIYFTFCHIITNSSSKIIR